MALESGKVGGKYRPVDLLKDFLDACFIAFIFEDDINIIK
jgi:hypothetical protein